MEMCIRHIFSTKRYEVCLNAQRILVFNNIAECECEYSAERKYKICKAKTSTKYQKIVYVYALCLC